MRLIDGDKLLEWLESEIASSSPADYVTAMKWVSYNIDKNKFDIPSNQGEARLREALEKTRRTLFDSGKHPGDRMAEIDVIIREALSHKGGNSDE